MPLPKSVTKIKKNKNGSVEISYVNNVDRINYTIQELTKAALRDSGKVLLKLLEQASPVASGNLKNAFASWNKYDKATGKQVLQIGTYYSKNRAEQKHKAYAPYLHLVLFPHRVAYKNMFTGEYVDTGRTTTGNNFFYNTVRDHLDDIRTTQGKYLSAIEDEMEATRLVEESEQMEDEN